MQTFPQGFLLGASTAAHQVEGNNIHSDYWTMEQMKSTSFTEPSLDAVDHYNRYEEDILLLKEAGLKQESLDKMLIHNPARILGA